MAIRDANAFYSSFMSAGWGDGTTGAALLPEVDHVDIDYWQNTDKPAVTSAYLGAFQTRLQTLFGTSTPVNLINRDTPGVDSGNAYSPSVVKKR